MELNEVLLIARGEAKPTSTVVISSNVTPNEQQRYVGRHADDIIIISVII